MPNADLIAAIATPPGTGGVGVVRVSGRAIHRLTALLSGQTLPPPRRAQHQRFLAADGGIIDDGLAIYFPAPQSFTGEDVLELHGHGGLFVMQRLLERCWQLGARPAEAGEFTLRAYRNDKLDLAQAEAVADIINAGSNAAAAAAAQSLSGAFSRALDEFARRLRRLRADLESDLDFSDEDAQTPAATAVLANITALHEELTALIGQTQQGVLLTGGVRAVIVGAPNVGKSSLLNRLCDEDAAIVSDVPGTTRDVIERRIVMDGLPLRVIDGAGLRDSADPIEKEGIARTRKQLQKADVVLAVTAVDAPQAPPLPATDSPRLLICNKMDLLDGAPPPQQDGAIYVSAKSGAGMENLRAALLRAVGGDAPMPPFSARRRHVLALQKALSLVQAAADAVAMPELAAAWLRDADEAVGVIIGVYDDDALLGDIFSKFCIGK